MRKHMNYLVLKEHRPFSFYDFLVFKADGKDHSMSHRTFRNKVSKMKKAGEIEVAYYSSQAFYTLKGVKFTKPMTGNHTGVPPLPSSLYPHHQRPANDPVHRLIQNLPLGKRALHDIHLRFKVNGIWSLISGNSTLQQTPDPISKDIRLSTWKIEDLDITATIHSTDTVSIVVGCSYAPIAADIAGVIRLSNALAVVQERLSKFIDDCANYASAGYFSLAIPNHKDWIVTMWHFGADSSTNYSGEKFFASWEIGQNALITVYSKDMKEGKTRIRLERQECPQKSLAEALEEKLDAVAGGGQNNND